MLSIVQPAYVLHRRAYRETSFLVSFITPDFGRVDAVIKGVRGQGAKAMQKQAWLQPFQALELHWRDKGPQSSSDLIQLQHFEPQTRSLPLYASANICGLYCNELLYRLQSKGLAASGVFSLYQQTLFDLAQTQLLPTEQIKKHQGWRLRLFEVALLVELGCVEIEVGDAEGHPLSPEQDYFFDAQQGAIPVNASHRWRGESITGQCLLALAQQQYCQSCLGAWKALMRRLLAPYLGEKPIHARQLLSSAVAKSAKPSI